MVWLIKFVHIFSFFLITPEIVCIQTVCQFNKLCICNDYTRQLSEVTCVGVNVRLNELPNNDFYRIRIIGSRDLAVIQSQDLVNVKSLSSLTITRSRLSSIESLAFNHSGVEQTLTTLELSNSALTEIPSAALAHLHRLQWLSLRTNKIEELKSKDLKALTSLRSLILSDNSLTVVPDHTFAQLSSLEFLDLDDNMISKVEGTPFPSSLKTLSLSNCLLQEVPFDSISNLQNIQILQFRGNLIRHLPQIKIGTKNIQMLDLSHNLITTIGSNAFSFTAETENPFNPQKRHLKEGLKSEKALKYSLFENNVNISNPRLRVKDLHLDFNFIQSLPNGLFGHISCERLSLSNNRITSAFISNHVFEGVIKDELKVLDLNYNLIDKFPNAIKSLTNIRQILLKNNKIKHLDDNSLDTCAHSLEVLDLSRNQLSEIPSALRVTKSLVRLSLYDNSIARVDDNCLGEWSQTLLSLSLSKNSLKVISREAFRHAKNLRELRLGGNNLLHTSPHIFLPLRALELLDLSFSLNYVNSRPLIQSVSIESLDSMKWLQLDYNRLKQMPTYMPFKTLMHYDLENNLINDISTELRANLNLSSINLSRNQLSVIKSQTFAQLPHLESIALYLNQINAIESNAFECLPKLKTIILSKNYINFIDFKAFHNLSSNSPSLSILLDENRLKCFSADIFGAMTNSQFSLKGFLYINVSHNEIKQLSDCAVDAYGQTVSDDNWVFSANQSQQTLNVRVLDLSFNQIQDIDITFMDTMCKSLHSLHLNHNRLIALPIDLLQVCTQLQILILNNNMITETLVYNNQTFVSELQVLELRQNKIKSLKDLNVIFRQLKNLRVLDLSYNLIHSLTQDLFLGTIISRLDLSHNSLSNIEIKDEMSFQTQNSCLGVKSSLKYLDLSHNYLNSVPIEVNSCENLIEVNLAYNLMVGSAMRSVNRFIDLRQIDLSYNPIKNIDNNSFVLNAINLNVLKLNNISITSMPSLNLPALVHLEVSQNMIALIDPHSMTISRNIRHLDLSKNQLQDVPRYLWKYMTKLQTLLIQYNPIDILDTSSFSELKHLRHLDIRGLNLQYIDTRLLHNHRYLLSIKSSTYPNVRSFRLHDLLAKTCSLRSALIEVQETTLSHQIQWAFGTKLKELVITGSNLIKILPDAFLGLYNTYDLTLRVTDTNISSLPSGLLKYLADIRFITIDLRKNKLKTLKPDVFLIKSDNSFNNWESQQMLGGILLDENPLKCDCDLIWISDWMKRLISDMRGLNIEAALHAHTMASRSQCIAYLPLQTELENASKPGIERMRRIPILDLRSEDIFCENISNKLTLNTVFIIVLLIVGINGLCFGLDIHFITNILNINK